MTRDEVEFRLAAFRLRSALQSPQERRWSLAVEEAVVAGNGVVAKPPRGWDEVPGVRATAIARDLLQAWEDRCSPERSRTLKAGQNDTTD